MTNTQVAARNELVRCVELAAAEGKPPHEIVNVIERENKHDAIMLYEVNLQMILWLAHEVAK